MFNLLALHSFHINFQLHVYCYKMNWFHCNQQASKSWWSYTSLNLPFTHSSTQLSIFSSAQNILCFCVNNSVSARNIFVFTLALSDLLLAASIPLTLGDALSQVGFQNLNLKSFSGTLIIFITINNLAREWVELSLIANLPIAISTFLQENWLIKKSYPTDSQKCLFSLIFQKNWLIKESNPIQAWPLPNSLLACRSIP